MKYKQKLNYIKKIYIKMIIKNIKNYVKTWKRIEKIETIKP